MDYKSLLPVKSDFVFKRIFGDQRNIEILAEFLKSFLDIPDDEYEHLTIVDPHIKKESDDDKYGILDIKINTKHMSVIHVEIQLQVFPELKQRTIYGHSKLFTEQISSGQDWSIINRVITIIITDEIFIPDNIEYFNQFRYRTKVGTEFTNLSEIITIDLRKLPSETDGTDLWNWTKFIKSSDEEDFKMLEQRNPQIKKAVAVLKELSADESARMLFDAQEFARRDAVALMKKAKTEGRAEGRAEGRVETAKNVVKNAINMGMDIKDIVNLTGLTHDEILIIQKEIL